jgi:S-DNA-T family DNA segregation ATPase FtsK/SpoIIIE
VRFLTPTENKRLNELVGFLCITIAILLGLSLLTYNPHDAAFNVSTASMGDHPARNWIGPVGAYMADLLFQFFGWTALLIPAALGILGWRWLRSRPM